MPNRDKLLCRSRPVILGMSKSTTKQPVRLSSGERKNSAPDENAFATNPIERINTSMAFPTALSSSTMATIGLLFGTWRNRQPRAALMEQRMSSARLFLFQPRRSRYVLRLYKCIGILRWQEICGQWSKLRHRHSPSYLPSFRLTLTRAPPAWTALEGLGRPQGRNRPRGRRTPP